MIKKPKGVIILSKLKNMKIAKKLQISNVISIIFIIIVGAIGFYYMNHLSKQSEEMYENDLLPIKWVNDVRAQSRANEALIKEIMLVTDSNERIELMNLMNERSSEIEREFDLYRNTVLSSFEKEKISIIEETQRHNMTHREEVFNLLKAGDTTLAFTYYKEKIDPHIETLNNELTVLADYLSERAEQTLIDIEKNKNRAIIITGIVILIASILAIVISQIITKIILNPLREVVNVMDIASKGDLTVVANYDSKDEIGIVINSFNHLIQSTRFAMEKVITTATELAASSQEISASTEQIAFGSQQQAQDTSSSASMMTEMTNVVGEVARNAENAAELAKKTMIAAQRGEEVICGSIEGVQVVSDSIYELANKSNQIGEIIEVINGIAEQTNLLALNAAIEAARAGEAGNGFAVVAEEVRKLAERSSNATKEISKLILDIQQNTENAVKCVEVGREETKRIESSFSEILELVGESTSKVVEIAAANEEQLAQAEEVQQAVSAIAAVTEEISAGIQETAATAESLAKMAEILTEVTDQFKIR